MIIQRICEIGSCCSVATTSVGVQRQVDHYRVFEGRGVAVAERPIQPYVQIAQAFVCEMHAALLRGESETGR